MTDDAVKIKIELPKILLVDDREVEREILQRILGEFKAELHFASSGEEALAIMLKHEFVLVLLDIQMKGMDGIETAKLMREYEPTANVPIIFMTSYAKDEIDMMQGYKVGAIDYLFKPINEEILISKVKSFLKAYEFEKDKEYLKILAKLEDQNKKLRKAQEEAVRMMEEANIARKASEKSEEQIQQQAQALIRSNKELEQFAYVATHDLRAPIINLNGLLKIFSKRGYVNEENQQIVDKIFLSVGRINSTLKDLINVVTQTNLENSQFEKIELDEMVSDIIKDLESQLEEVDYELETDFSEVPEIKFIPMYLHSILQNLITNAIKYRREEVPLLIQIKSYSNEEFDCIQVKDNGQGIGEGKKDKVFQLFQRLDTNVPGKGMGLFISKSQIESFGGYIDYISQEGVGSEFTVYFKKVN